MVDVIVISRSKITAICLSILALVAIALAPAQAETFFTRSQIQYIAALGDPNANSGNDAQDWGLWTLDPGPRGVRLGNYASLIQNGGIAPAGWQFQSTGWWLEENGLIMEAPSFPLPPGKYVVTGGRRVTSVLTVEPADETGKQAWSLADGASIYDVTHLRCRAALYTARDGGQSCTPDNTPTNIFPMRVGVSMPEVNGCRKQDYQVLIVVGMMSES